MATWTIANLERNTADGGVTVAHWRVTETETVGEGDDAVTYSASSYGTVGFTLTKPKPKLLWLLILLGRKPLLLLTECRGN
jgi:hypothetical protein